MQRWSDQDDDFSLYLYLFLFLFVCIFICQYVITAAAAMVMHCRGGVTKMMIVAQSRMGKEEKQNPLKTYLKSIRWKDFDF